MRNGGKTIVRAAVMLAAWAFISASPAEAGTWWATNTAVKYVRNFGVEVGADITNEFQPHYWNKDENDKFIFANLSGGSSAHPAALFSIPALKAAPGADSIAPIVYGSHSSLYGYASGVIGWKGGAVSDRLGRIMTGNTVSTYTNRTSLPVSFPWTRDVTVFAIDHNIPTIAFAFDGLDFNQDGDYLYSNVYAPSASRNQIYKWNVVNLAANGVGLTSNSTFLSQLKRIRNVNVYRINGRDLVYYGEGDASVATNKNKVCVYDTVANTETVLAVLPDVTVTLLEENDIVNAKVGGIGLAQMHLYVQHDNGALHILDLGADGKTANLVKTFEKADMTNLLGTTWRYMRSFEVSNDEQYAFVGHHPTGALYVVWSPAEISLLGTNGATMATGAAPDPALGTDFGVLAFGAAPMNRVFSITNSGNADLTINAVTTNGSSAFQITGVPAAVSPGAVGNFTVAFSPAEVGIYTALVALANNRDTVPYIVNLLGVVIKGNQTISFPAIPDQDISNTVALAATASSGLPVSFAVETGPGAISGGSNLTFSATGVVTVVASQSGDANWNPAFSVTNMIAVTSSVPVAAVSAVISADYDGDGLADPAVYDEETGTWKIKLSSANYLLITTTLGGLGGPGWASVSADYDGDGKADPAVYHEMTGRWTVVLSSSNCEVLISMTQPLGGPGYSGIPADYDGDQLADPGIYHRALGDWKVLMSAANYFQVEALGLLGGAGFRAVAADYDGDSLADPAVYGESSGIWSLRLSSAAYVEITMGQTLGGTGYIPVPADYDGDQLADPAVRSENGNEWIVMFSTGGYTPVPVPVTF